MKLHINLPLTITKDPKAKAAKKKAEQTAAAAQAANKKSSKSSSSSSLTASKKRFTHTLDDDTDPFTDLVDIIQLNFIDADECVEQINGGTDLDSLINSQTAGGATGRKTGAKSTAVKSTSTASSSSSSASVGSSIAAPLRSPSAKKRSSRLAASQQLPTTITIKPTREALCDAQLKQIINNENRLLSARIRRLHRNGMMEIRQLKHYNEKVFLPKLDEYLELRIHGESDAVDALIYHIKVNHIEKERTITQQIKIEGENVFIEADLANQGMAS